MKSWCIAGAGLLLGSAAFAKSPSVALLSAGTAVGDGAMPHLLHVVLLDDDGQGVEDASLRASATEGQVGPLRAVSPGVYALEYIPARRSREPRVRS